MGGAWCCWWQAVAVVVVCLAALVPAVESVPVHRGHNALQPEILVSSPARNASRPAAPAPNAPPSLVVAGSAELAGVSPHGTACVHDGAGVVVAATTVVRAGESPATLLHRFDLNKTTSELVPSASISTDMAAVFAVHASASGRAVYAVGQREGYIGSPTQFVKVGLEEFSQQAPQTHVIELNDTLVFRDFRASALVPPGTLQHATTIGDDAREEREMEDTATNTHFVLTGHRVPHATGEIQAWRMYVGAAGVVVAQVWREVVEGERVLVGENELKVSSPGFHHVAIPPAQRIRTQSGDAIGFRLPSTSPAPILFAPVDPASDLAPTRRVEWVGGGGGVVVGQAAVFAGASAGEQARVYSLSASCVVFAPLGHNVSERAMPEAQGQEEELAEAVVEASSAPTPLPASPQTTVDPSLRLSHSAVVGAWEVFVCPPGASGTVVLQVWRPSPTNNTMSLVGETTVTVSSVARRHVIAHLAEDERFAVEEGDLVGWRESEPGLVCFDGVAPSTPPPYVTLPVSGIVDSLNKTDVERTYSVAVHLIRPPVEDDVVVAGTYTEPARILSLNLNDGSVLASHHFDEKEAAFLNGVVVDTATQTAVFIADMTPTTLVQVQLGTLAVVRTVVVEGHNRAFALAADLTARSLYVATDGSVVEVDLDQLKVVRSVGIQGQARSLAVNHDTGVIYLGLLDGKLERVSTHSSDGELKVLGRQEVVDGEGERVGALTAVLVHHASRGLLERTNISAFDTLALSSTAASSVLVRLRSIGPPTLSRLSPCVGHVGGGTVVAVVGSNVDASASCVAMRAPDTPNVLFAQHEGAVRVVGAKGEASAKGRLETRTNGVWESVCADLFDARAAGVACRALGYGGGGYVGACSDAGGPCGDDAQPILQNATVCQGFEHSLAQCDPRQAQNCDHTSDVVVACDASTQGPMRLSSAFSGGKLVMRTAAVHEPTSLAVHLYNDHVFASSHHALFEWYDAKIESMAPTNLPHEGSSAIVFGGSGIACDPTAAALRFVNASGVEIFRPASSVLSCSPTQITLQVQTTGRLPAHRAHRVELSLDGQFWLAVPQLLYLSHLETGEVAPLLGPVRGGARVRVECSGVVDAPSLRVGVFLSPAKGAQPQLVLSSDAVSLASDAVHFTAPQLGEAGQVFWGIALDGQNFAVSHIPFWYYHVAYGSLLPAHSVVDGGARVLVKATGLVRSGSVKVKVGSGSGAVEVNGRYVDEQALQFVSPPMDAVGDAPIAVALDGVTFEDTGLHLRYFDPEFTSMDPPLFLRHTASELTIAGSGFVEVPLHECLVSFKLPTEKAVVQDCTALSEDAIVVVSPLVGHVGDAEVTVSFNGGQRFLTTGLNATAYDAAVTNISPALVRGGSSVTLLLRGSGFVQTDSASIVLRAAGQGAHDFGGAVGTGWRLVRRVQPGAQWHPAADALRGWDQYGEPSTSPTAGSTFSVLFNDTAFDEFLFATGDLSSWVRVPREALWAMDGVSEVSGVVSSLNPNEHTVQWTHLDTNADEPVVTLSDYSDVSAPTLYAGESSTEHTTALRAHNGANVFVSLAQQAFEAKFVDEEKLMVRIEAGQLAAGTYEVCLVMGTKQPFIVSQRQIAVLPSPSGSLGL